jgi:hypothetical protein
MKLLFTRSESTYRHQVVAQHVQRVLKMSHRMNFYFVFVAISISVLTVSCSKTEQPQTSLRLHEREIPNVA